MKKASKMNLQVQNAHCTKQTRELQPFLKLLKIYFVLFFYIRHSLKKPLNVKLESSSVLNSHFLCLHYIYIIFFVIQYNKIYSNIET